MIKVSIDYRPIGYKNPSTIFKLHISRGELVRDLGFGHEITNHEVKLLVREPETLVRLAKARGEKYPRWSVEKEGKILGHDRRDGTISLVRKALESVGE